LAGGEEVYEITIQSEEPPGWIRCYVPKQAGAFALPSAAGVNFRRIEKVAPFLSREEAERNHFKTLNLPFLIKGPLRFALALDQTESDLTQVRVTSIRSVRFTHIFRWPASDLVDVSDRDGYEMDLATPAGPVRYYVSLNGEHVAKPGDIRNPVSR
jgi:hypothetical protein